MNSRAGRVVRRVLTTAIPAAEADLVDRMVFVLNDAAWTDLQELLDRPPKPQAGVGTPAGESVDRRTGRPAAVVMLIGMAPQMIGACAAPRWEQLLRC
ncbi:DUF1778 domain-containing protein [[Mycobacterium] zoologicum]|uniref:type II toxin -antitoxin system TacA 1-like antitoxin n=1 Tax=[Mycobacterium] zoologicum TaxID=2872311 RepID=UPI0039E06027